MAQYVINDTRLSAIADAIRDKSGSTDTYTVDEMPEAIAAIQTGGGGGGGTSSGGKFSQVSLTGTQVSAQDGYETVFDLSNYVSSEEQAILILKVDVQTANSDTDNVLYRDRVIFLNELVPYSSYYPEYSVFKTAADSTSKTSTPGSISATLSSIGTQTDGKYENCVFTVKRWDDSVTTNKVPASKSAYLYYR